MVCVQLKGVHALTPHLERKVGARSLDHMCNVIILEITTNEFRNYFLLQTAGVIVIGLTCQIYSSGGRLRQPLYPLEKHCKVEVKITRREKAG